MNNLEIFFNTIVVSIPEAYLLVYITLVILRRKEFFEKKYIKKNIAIITLFLVIPFIVFSVPLYYLDINLYIRLLMNAILLAFLIYVSLGYLGDFINTKKTIMDIGKVLFASIICFCILNILEVFVVILLQYLFNFDIGMIKSNVIINIIFALPTKLVMFFIIYLYYMKQNTPDSVVLNMVWRNKDIFKKFIFLQIIFNTIIAFIIYNKFVINNILEGLESEKQFFIIFLILIFIILEIMLPWFTIITMKLKQGNEVRRNYS